MQELGLPPQTAGRNRRALWQFVEAEVSFRDQDIAHRSAQRHRCEREVLDAVLEWIPTWEDDPANAYRGAKAIVNVGGIEGGFGWRVSRTPHRTDLFLDVRVPPTKEMAAARGDVIAFVRSLAERFPE